MKTVDNLNWIFTFGKHKHQTIKESIENNPSSFSSGVVDIYGNRVWKGDNILASSSFISYLEWAENEKILNVLPEIWTEIKLYDSLYTTIKSYENGNKGISSEKYNETLKKFNELKNEI